MAENTVSVIRDAEESRGQVGGTSQAAWSDLGQNIKGGENLVLCCEKVTSELVMCEEGHSW